MDMFEELKAWADKWGVPYGIEKGLLPEEEELVFFGKIYADSTCSDAFLCFTYKPKQNTGAWYGSFDCTEEK